MINHNQHTSLIQVPKFKKRRIESTKRFLTRVPLWFLYMTKEVYKPYTQFYITCSTVLFPGPKLLIPNSCTKTIICNSWFSKRNYKYKYYKLIISHRLKHERKNILKLGSASCKTASPKSRKNWRIAWIPKDNRNCKQ